MANVIERVPGAPPREVLGRKEHFHARGGVRQWMIARDPEVLLEGPKGTGKTRGVLEKLHLIAQHYDGCRILVARKTRVSLTSTVLVTFEEKVLDGASRTALATDKPARSHRHEYVYPNGSRIMLVGLDRPSRLQSGEFDIIYVAEATELLESDAEMLIGLLRNGVLPYQQLVMDCNPSYPTHWLNQRCRRGTTRRIITRHRENPYFFDVSAGDWTEVGRAYMDKLDRLSGFRRARLRDGLWAAAEGMVYESWDAARHVVERRPIPEDWRRWWVVDFGFSNPFVWQAWAEDPDGRLIMYREIYYTRRLVEDHAESILLATEGEPPPVEIICDHDAEDRATLERHLTEGVWARGPVGQAEVCEPQARGARLIKLPRRLARTRPAFKNVSAGLQAVESRLRDAGDGRPRLMLMAESLVERDGRLDMPDAGDPLPAATAEEVEGYIMDTRTDRPVKESDHGMDAMRYVVARVDRIDLARPQGSGSRPESASDKPRPKRLAGVRSREF